MTAATTTARARPAFVALLVYTLRACLPGKRWIAAALLAVASILLGFIASNIQAFESVRAFAEVATTALFGLVMPVTCLVIGDAILGAEVRSGSFTFTWMSPVPTWQIAIARWLGGSLIAAGGLAAAFALSSVVAGAPESAGSVALAAAFGAQAYVAVFLAIGCIAKRAAVWSLAFVFLVERLLGAALAGIAQWSPSWEARATFVGLSDGPSALVRESIPQGAGALVRLCLISAIALILTSTRLRRLKLTGSVD